jgi:HD-GYP domain-containing protein (c-di-GMP phosphodiesterase class II)
MISLDLLLVVLGGWLALSLLAIPLAQPLLSAVGLADRNEAAVRHDVRIQAPALETPKSAGYAGLVHERLLQHACRVQGVEEACLLVYDRDRPGRCVVVAGHGIDVDLLGRRFPTGAGRRPASVSGLPAGLRAPIRVGGEERGMLVLGPTITWEPGEPDMIGPLTTLIGAVLAHRDSGELPHTDARPEIAGLVALLQAADHHTESHCQSVATLACSVGRELGLDAADMFELELTARLHDVGKLHVPRAILDKPGPLDAQERELVRMHPEWGSEIVSRIPGLAAVALLVRLHHERIDATGYPDGLPGERIPIVSRIVAVCDAHSAIVDDRPYRAGRSEDEALAELRRHAGTQFDADVVAALERTLVPVAV